MHWIQQLFVTIGVFFSSIFSFGFHTTPQAPVATVATTTVATTTASTTATPTATQPQATPKTEPAVVKKTPVASTPVKPTVTPPSTTPVVSQPTSYGPEPKLQSPKSYYVWGDAAALFFGSNGASTYSLDSAPVSKKDPIPGLDPSSFTKVTSKQVTSPSKMTEYVAKDKNNVYYYTSANNQIEVILSADPVSFTCLHDTTFCKDHYRVFDEQGMVTNADASSLSYLGSNYYKDKLHFYFGNDVIFVNNAPAFKVLGQSMATDNTHIYCDGSVLLQADPQSFKLLPSGFSEDNRNVYYGCTIPNALASYDPKTFIMLNSSYVRDVTHVTYWNAKGTFANVPRVDVSTFTVLTGDYAKDHSDVYYQDKLVVGADPSTFQVCTGSCTLPDGTWYTANDAKHFYSNEQQVK